MISLDSFYSTKKQDQRFIVILFALLIFYVFFAVLVPFVEQKEVDREIVEKIPPQLTRILLEEKQIPIPEKIIEDVIEEKIEEPKKEEPKPEEPKPEPITTREAAKQKAKSSGLAAMKDELLAMRESFVIKPTNSDVLQDSSAEQVRVKRKLIAAKATAQSGGATAASVSTTVVSDELSTLNTQTVRLSDEEIKSDSLIAAQESQAEAFGNQRSEMKLRQTLEANKSRLYALYSRALRKDPFLQGKVVFNLTIEPNGSLSLVAIDSSELNNSKLERQLLVILRSIDFGAEDVVAITTIWAIEFLPR